MTDGITALLGPTNTGKTHRAVERMLEHRTGMMGLPLRLLAREVYDRVTARIGEQAVALVTGEEKRVPARPRYWICTVESMPVMRDVDFVAVDEVQLATHPQRGHTFTDRLLHTRGVRETWFMGAAAMGPIVEELLPTARIQDNPRFSRLSYVGTLSIGALPPRTAVVAFSVADVYDLAERLRQRHGGTAVVTGSLSPRTRNAQVAMYQAGEVDYMVATDAIGMGLNLEIDRVVFAALHKYDGSEVRPLDLAELGQIAGRAGRYTADGGFGTLRPLPGLEPRVVAAVEHHAFDKIRQLVWRNSDLDFASIDALIASLRRRSGQRMLRLVERADDFEALLQLVRNDEIRARARTPEAVELLWDVCRIPDYRKLLLESHVQLLAAIYLQLTGASERIEPDWIGQRLRTLNSVDGDIDVLTHRISFIRTWTYVAHHERWLADAAGWQARTRELEDRCSDALHQRLAERFVARHQEGHVRVERPRRPLPGQPEQARADEDHPFARLRALQVPAGPPSSTAARGEWFDAVIEAPHDELGLDAAGHIVHEGRVLAELVRGAGLLHPELRLLELGVGAGVRARLLRRLQAWTKDATSELLAPLEAVATDDATVPWSPSARGLLYQLEQGLGTLDARPLRAQLERLREHDRERLAGAGVQLGAEVVHVPSMARPALLRLRAALWHAQHGPRVRASVPDAHAVSLACDDVIDIAYYPHVGYLVRGPRAIRADVLQRVYDELVALPSAGPLPADLGARLGTRKRELPAVLRALGWRVQGEQLIRVRDDARAS